MTSGTIRVLVADDDEQVRSALRLLIEQQPDLRLAAEAGSATEAIRQALVTRPEVILLDWQLCGGGRDLVQSLHGICPDAAIVALSAQPECRKVAFAAGAAGFSSKNDPPQTLVSSLERIASKLHPAALTI